MLLQVQTVSEFSIIPQIGTAIGLIAFIVAIVFYYLRTQSGNDLEKIKSAKEDERANLLRDLSDKYSVPTDKISPDHQFKLLQDKLELDYRKRNQTFKFLAFVTVIVAVLVALIIRFDGKKPQPIPTPTPMKVIFDNITTGDTILTATPEVKGKITGTIPTNTTFYAVLKNANQYGLTTKLDVDKDGKFDFNSSIGYVGQIKIGIISCDEVSANSIENQFKKQIYTLNSLPNGSELIGAVDIYKK